MFGASKLYNIFFNVVTTAISKSLLVTTIFDGKACLPELALEPMTCIFGEYSRPVRPRHRRSFDR